MNDFTRVIQDAVNQNNPLKALRDFLDRERAFEQAAQYSQMSHVGYVLNIEFDKVRIVTNDALKVGVGGIPRNSLLIMVPWSAGDPKEDADVNSLPPHFTLLRVVEAAPTPLTLEDQKTYFELHKQSMPEMDIFTRSNLQWGALNTSVLGMFYPNPERPDDVEFAGDINNYVSAHKYRVYAPDSALLDLIVNSQVSAKDRYEFGQLRLTECRMQLPGRTPTTTGVYLTPTDFKGMRTALFGQTRMGKSNVVKLIAEMLIQTSEVDRSVGQLIFDIDGEYANDNPQNISLTTAFASRTTVYAIVQKPTTQSKPLKMNMYESPSAGLNVLRSLLSADGKDSDYVRAFVSHPISEPAELADIRDMGDRIHMARRILIFWGILKRAQFAADETVLGRLIRCGMNGPSGFDPHFNKAVREGAYGGQPPPAPTTLDELIKELDKVYAFFLQSSSHADLFDEHEKALLAFLFPAPGRSGVTMIRPYHLYHDARAGDFVSEILDHLDKGMTVVLDMSNANETIMQYFGDMLSREVLRHQKKKFTENRLGSHYVMLYFEEAHNLFPKDADPTTIYAQLAKQGAKFHTGIVYSTQSVTTVYYDLLSQTNNFFVGHMSSRNEVEALAKSKVQYDSVKEDILRTQSRGYLRMLSMSHRFVVPVQAKLFKPNVSQAATP